MLNKYGHWVFLFVVLPLLMLLAIYSGRKQGEWNRLHPRSRQSLKEQQDDAGIEWYMSPANPASPLSSK